MIKLLSTALAAFVLFSCQKDDPALSQDKAITSFAFLAIDNPGLSSDVDGIITADAIHCTFPTGAVVTALKPAIVHLGSTVSPAPGKPVDFTDPVSYSVTAKDKSILKYTVSVTVTPPVLSSNKIITSFSFLKTDNPTLSADVQGTISGKNILCAMPAGVAVTALKPTIIYTGSSLDPASGTIKNFSTPVIYTVMAEDGSKLEYSVSVSVAAAPAVYVAGTQFIRGTSQVTVWKDGVETKLTNGAYNAFAHSIFVSGNTIHVAGVQNIGRPYATYWIENGTGSTAQELNAPANTNGATANSIYVSNNNDVYVAGEEYGATVWKNGTATYLSPGVGSNATSVFVSGNDVYVAGWLDTPTGRNATVWKNGIATTLSSTDKRSEGYAVFVSNNDVYVAGIYYTETALSVPSIKIWKNGVAEIITPDTQGAEVSSIFVSNGNTYIAGHELTDNAWQAKIWKNLAGTVLSSVHLSDARSIYVHNGNVYVAGWVPDNNDKKIATLWKNGVASVLAKDALATEAFAWSLMVK